MRLELVAAATHPRESATYYEGLRACYGRFDAEGAASGRQDGDRRVGLFFILARDRHTIVGGVGIHLRLAAGTFPVERALGRHALLEHKLSTHRSVAELSGLWLDGSMRGSGLSKRLMQAGMAALPLLGADVGIGFSHQHVLALYATIGLYPDPELSSFAYPDDRYLSSVLWADALELTGVHAVVKRRILKARTTFINGDKVRLPSERPPAREDRERTVRSRSTKKQAA